MNKPTTAVCCVQRLTLDAGSEIVEKVIVGTAQWSELFAKHDFFHKYRYYLQVIASTGDPDLHIKWYVECRSCLSCKLTAILGPALSSRGFASWS